MNCQGISWPGPKEGHRRAVSGVHRPVLTMVISRPTTRWLVLKEWVVEEGATSTTRVMRLVPLVAAVASGKSYCTTGGRQGEPTRKGKGPVNKTYLDWSVVGYWRASHVAGNAEKLVRSP